MHDMSSSGSDDEEDDIPPREVCEKLCKEFADVTGTDTALAQFYLQDRRWDLQASLNAYFGASETSSSSPAGKSSKNRKRESERSSQDKTEMRDRSEPDRSKPNRSEPNRSGPCSIDRSEPHRFRLMSWNIDGLDDNNLITRTAAVCDIIQKEKPDVVLLQEVVVKSEQELRKRLSGEFHILPADHQGYYTAALLRKATVKPEQQEVVPFYSSKMCRNLNIVDANIKGISMCLMTSHLESTKPHRNERIKQLKLAFERVKVTDEKRSVIFGGDLNLRDEEVFSAGGVPDGIYDAWASNGKRPEAQWTWDSARNDNLECNFKSKQRFDRVYIRHSKPKPQLKLVYFELVGLERVASCRRFPSDHWGILTHYDIID